MKHGIHYWKRNKINDCFRLNLTHCFCYFDWRCERILWIGHAMKINKHSYC